MIHPQLAADCHELGRFKRCAVLLNKNATLPWFILVPDTTLQDVLDLSPALLGEVVQECQRISSFLKQSLGYAKVNFAGLGNVVPQMHLHIIARAEDDACWPQPVWGNLSQHTDYEPATLAAWVDVLGKEFKLAGR